ncbi:hypothetical protein HLB44_24025 [Aquincola sp. S2]|uniref:Uncharacterized protein n=1 Tax=Pseudaquabacterium terrae TaxID=2732868 RepID=A0ABX2END1_9BURK|nr:hypothetical protein [Aquabacterium terrae]NRF70078.1 hypothetical protein [Aquabacterium terrae]
MMRMVFSVVALLVVVFVMLKLGKDQTAALKSTAGPAASGAGGAQALPEKYKQDVQRALEQGMQQRASEPTQ